MSYTKIQNLQHQEESLRKDIQTLKDTLLEEDDPEKEKVWEDNIISKENELSDIVDKISSIQKEIKDNFVNNIIHKRDKHMCNPNNENFLRAKKDAEDTVFGTLAMAPDEIAVRFSTENFIIKPIPGTQVFPKTVEFKWYHEFRKDRFNDKIVPLSPGIKQPMRFCSRLKKKKKIFFFIDKIYSDKEFVRRCNEYYKQYNMSITIKRDKDYYNRFWIVLSVLDDGRIIFP